MQIGGVMNMSHYSFDQSSNISDYQYDDYTNYHNQCAYFDYANFQRPHHDTFHSFNDFYDNSNRNIYQKNQSHNFNNEMYNHLYFGYTENECFYYDYKTRLRNVLNDLTPNSCSANSSDVNSNVICEPKPKTKKKTSKSLFKKNSIRNYINYNQIIEYFK